MTILAAQRWRTNADMILDVVALGYIKPDDLILDLTFGRGKWWTQHQPAKLYANLDPWLPLEEAEAIITAHPWLWGARQSSYLSFVGAHDAFDVVVFDPPYVAKGGRSTSGITEFDARYGLKDAPKSPLLLHQYNVAGLREAMRVCRPGGFVMTKCQDYISSGRLQPASHWMLADGLEMGLRLHDKLIHVGNAGPQPGGRRVVHARQNASVLLVFEKPRGRRRKAT